jgi:pimeloyl-ACP methyl ester carboxylesterase
MGRVKGVHLNGVDLEYAEDGDGVPVVFAHGAGSDLRYWESQREAFAATYRYVAYSQRYRGSGTAAPADGDESARAHATDLVALIRWLDAGPVHLVGFSSAVAIRATLLEPRLVRSLTVIEPNLPWLLEGDAEGERLLAGWRRDNERLRAAAGDDAEQRATLWFDLVNNGERGAFALQATPFREMWLDNMTSARPTPPPPEPIRCEQLATIRAPTLVIATEHGMPYSRLIVERVAGCIPGSRLVTIPDATHFVSYQSPGVFNAVVLELIAGL